MPGISTSKLLATLMSTLCILFFSGLAFAQSTPIISRYTIGTNQTTLTLVGTNFGTTAGTVSLDGSSATIVSWANTTITIDLSALAGPGTLAVVASDGTEASMAFTGVERGYYTLTSNGVVTAHGAIPTYGDLQTLPNPPASAAVELVPTLDNKGYWILTQSGSVYGFGDAASFGAVNASITAVAMAPTPSGSGVYVLSSTGTVYTLGQATNYGSVSSPIQASAMAVTPSGTGYWVLASNGTVYAFGDAQNFGSANVSEAATAPVYPNGSLVEVPSSPSVFLVEHGTVYSVPNIAVLKGMGYTMADVKRVPSLAGYTLGPPLVVPYADGTVLAVANSTNLYWVQDGLIHPFASPTIFKASHIPTTQVQTVSSLRPNWPVGSTISAPLSYVPNGSLYRVQGHSTVYVLDNGTLDAIATGAVFRSMGLQWNAVNTVSALPAYPLGSPITTPTLLLADGTLWRLSSTGQVYVDENGQLCHIASARLFNAIGFQWKHIHNVSSLGKAPIGPAIGSAAIPPAVGDPTTSAISLVPTTTGQGYWILLQNGVVVTQGNAQSFGQLSAAQLGAGKAVSLAVTPDQAGYSVLTSTGQIYSFGDALAGATAPGAVSLAMSAQPAQTVTPSAGGFFSMAYGSFMPNYDGSFTTLLDNAAGLSAIVPTWYYEQQNPTTLQWSPGSPPSGFAGVVSQAHSEGVQVWPMIGATSVGPFQNASNIALTVRQLVSDAVQNDYDGITIDFEPSQFNGLSMAQAAQQFTNFLAQLGPALHSAGKGLMVDTYAAFYPHSPYNLTAIAPYVNYINIMTYGKSDDVTEAGPDASLAWMSGVYQTAISDGVNPAQIIMGFGPYGDYWSFNNSGLDQGAPLGSDSYVSDAQVQQLLKANPSIVPVWDPADQSEIFMTDEYVNANGDWTVNPNGEAVAPTDVLSTADEATFMPQVQNLQGLLNYILVRYAVDNQETVPSFLNLAQDGHYGPLTAEAVTQFQQDFDVKGATPGVYDAATQAALQKVIQQWGLGEYQYWLDTTQSMQTLVEQVAVADNLGGMAVWRLPFETSDFWQTLESTVSIAHGQQGGN
ncbi:MAG: glycoside hydrolase [Sulfobacillus acidophilus]|uniref:Glycoside hydrolase n=1 Tax=Sulfobacillus acidophilus TaxID=53633 RepID=A0A2T2WF21_9FIRM|nr:MAG: glycoside hydrolase [Sulfobacillus acidophilus]